ncbi:MAG: hypothetical protein J1F09_05705 [Oscillospiraceae bacterium]|nr:hypothetical protein [Oscillospiraceae bacterium]
MKKIFAVLLCLAVVLAAGCSSGVSQEEYDALVEENSQLKSDNSDLLGTKNSLTKEINSLESEKTELEQEINDLKNNHSSLDYCLDISTWMLGRPQSTVHLSDGYELEITGTTVEAVLFDENFELTEKIVITFKRTLPSQLIAQFMKSFEDTYNLSDMIEKGLTEGVVIYRYDDGAVIMSHFWYLRDGIENKKVWSDPGMDVMEKFEKAS